MSPAEYRTALTCLSLSQREAARFFGRDERSSHTWASPSGTGPPQPVAMWLAFMVATGITPAQVEEIISTAGPILARG